MIFYDLNKYKYLFSIDQLTGNPLESSGCYAILKPFVAKSATPNKLELIDLTV
jgi:hypothetical protein